MTIQTISSREFTRDVAAAKAAAAKGPVIITDRGKPAHVLLTIDEYERLTGSADGMSLLRAMDGLPSTETADLPLTSREPADSRRIPDFGPNF